MLSAQDIFEAELSKREIPFHHSHEEGIYKVIVDGVEITVNLENVSRDFDREHNPEIIIHFVEQTINIFKLPHWESAQSLVYFSAEPSDYDFGETIHYPVTTEVTKVLVLTDVTEAKITWITPGMLQDWQVSQKDVEAAAQQNMAKLLENKQPEVHEIDGVKLGMIPIQSVFKASIMFSPAFKAFVAHDIGWPVFVVIPCRDFMYVLAEKDKAFLNRLGTVVQKEYRTSGYPITTEVLRASDDGIEAIGKYPE
jgi:uncharacterized protein YtpQ (UPF0354 family)